MHSVRYVGCQTGLQHAGARRTRRCATRCRAGEVVERIVEPERQRHFAGPLRRAFHLGKLRQAFAQVLQRMVVAMRSRSSRQSAGYTAPHRRRLRPSSRQVARHGARLRRSWTAAGAHRLFHFAPQLDHGHGVVARPVVASDHVEVFRAGDVLRFGVAVLQFDQRQRALVFQCRRLRGPRPWP